MTENLTVTIRNATSTAPVLGHLRRHPAVLRNPNLAVGLPVRVLGLVHGTNGTSSRVEVAGTVWHLPTRAIRFAL